MSGKRKHILACVVNCGYWQIEGNDCEAGEILIKLSCNHHKIIYSLRQFLRAAEEIRNEA